MAPATRGFTKFAPIFTLLHNLSNTATGARKTGQRMYRCTCTICDKAGVFHLRLASAKDDFYLLGTLNLYESLASYCCREKNISFYSSRTYGCRCL
jgi:hypothetical protein